LFAVDIFVYTILGGNGVALIVAIA